MKLGKYEITGESKDCFVIAEIGHNHQGSMELAVQMIKAAADSGANAVKLQKRDNRSLFTKEAYDRLYENENSFGKTYGEHREALEFDVGQYARLKAYAESLGLIFFATPFDIPSVRFLEEVGVPCYKVASALITDIPLLEAIAETGKPVFMSTGACTIDDIDRAYKVFLDHGNGLCIMHCIAAYPMMDYKEANMDVLGLLAAMYPDAVLGFSSHESGIVLPVVAYMLGARVIEKHFTLNRAMKGTDQQFSLEPSGMTKMVRDLKRVEESMGNGVKMIQLSEQDARRKLGKSIYARADIKVGDIISPAMLCFKSPAAGLPPYMYDRLLGKKALFDVSKDSLLKLEAAGEKMKEYGKVDWRQFVRCDDEKSEEAVQVWKKDSEEAYV